MGEDWRAREEDLNAIAAARNSDPFGVLGPHQTPAGWVIRVFAPEAVSVRALTRGGRALAELLRRKDDVFEALIPSPRNGPPIGSRLRPRMGSIRISTLTRSARRSARSTTIWRGRARTASSTPAWRPPHSSRRRGRRLVRCLGANATRVSVVGEFNRWDGRRSQMRRRFDSGLWEIFIPELTAGAIYKFELLGPGGALCR